MAQRRKSERLFSEAPWKGKAPESRRNAPDEEDQDETDVAETVLRSLGTSILSNKTPQQLAVRILEHAFNVLFQRTLPNELQFIEFFESSIGNVVRTFLRRMPWWVLTW